MFNRTNNRASALGLGALITALVLVGLDALATHQHAATGLAQA